MDKSGSVCRMNTTRGTKGLQDECPHNSQNRKESHLVKIYPQTGMASNRPSYEHFKHGSHLDDGRNNSITTSAHSLDQEDALPRNSRDAAVVQFFRETLKLQRKWIIGTMETSVKTATEDFERMLKVVNRNDNAINHMRSSYTHLEKSLSQAVQCMSAKLSDCNGRYIQATNEAKQIKQRAEQLMILNSEKALITDDRLTRYNTENILELCKLNDEIESLINCIKKELYSSDEKRRIYMDSIRGRIHTSNMFTRNALQVWKKAALKSLARTNNSITTKLKEERKTWKNDMDLIKDQNTKEMDQLDRTISLLEAEAKNLIQTVVKKLESLEKNVHIDGSSNEDFRKMVRSHISSNKGSSERSEEEVTEVKEGLLKNIKETDTRLQTFKSDMETNMDSKIEDIKIDSDILDKQIKYLSRLVRILLNHVSKSTK
ncbi:paramyosin-like [Mytilus edulis]|uniref:paramyosin-like n=1 Tax=Mytilus edulis TaxID=6550 RepID=UPI0039F0DA94